MSCDRKCCICKKTISFLDTDCVWICHRGATSAIYRMYYCLSCFKSVAGEEITQDIITKGIVIK